MLLLHLEIFNNLKNITHYQWLLKQNINNFEICLLSSVTITFQNCVLISSQYQEFVIFLNKHCKTSKPQKPLIQICIPLPPSVPTIAYLFFLALLKVVVTVVMVWAWPIASGTTLGTAKAATGSSNASPRQHLNRYFDVWAVSSICVTSATNRRLDISLNISFVSYRKITGTKATSR